MPFPQGAFSLPAWLSLLAQAVDMLMPGFDREIARVAQRLLIQVLEGGQLCSRAQWHLTQRCEAVRDWASDWAGAKAGMRGAS